MQIVLRFYNMVQFWIEVIEKYTNQCFKLKGYFIVQISRNNSLTLSTISTKRFKFYPKQVSLFNKAWNDLCICILSNLLKKAFIFGHSMGAYLLANRCCINAERNQKSFTPFPISVNLIFNGGASMYKIYKANTICRIVFNFVRDRSL